ncbi:MAG: STAS domain-containing protein [Nocardioidaceae bacterium]
MTDLARVEGESSRGAHVVRVTGEVDLSNARGLLDTISRAVPGDAGLVVLDLSHTTYLDSAGIAMIFRLGERLHYSRQELRLVVPVESPIRAVVELTNVRHVIPVMDALVEAQELD